MLILVLTPMMSPIAVSASGADFGAAKEVVAATPLGDLPEQDSSASENDSSWEDGSYTPENESTAPEEECSETEKDSSSAEEKDSSIVPEQESTVPEKDSVSPEKDSTSPKPDFRESGIENENGDSLYPVLSDTTENAELSIYSSAEDSDVEVTPVQVNTKEEGLEVVKGYIFEGKEDPEMLNAGPDDAGLNEGLEDIKDAHSDEEDSEENRPDEEENNSEEDSSKKESSSEKNSENGENTEENETLYVKAETAENVTLSPREKMSLYSVEDGRLKDIIIEDISEDNGLCEIDGDVAGIALVKDTGYRHLNLEVYPDSENLEKKITLDGMMPKNANATVIEENDNREVTLVAYDITISDENGEYQPGEDRPIEVTIEDNRISTGLLLSLWHIKDDGSREEITEFTVEDGQIRFAAKGFSVYEIEQVPEPPITEAKYAISLLDFGADDADDRKVASEGFYLFYGNGNYFTNSINGNNAFIETNKISSASLWYFEDVVVDEENNKVTCKISTDVNGVRKYLRNSSGNNIALTNNKAQATVIEITSTDESEKFFFKHNSENKWLQHSGTGSGIRFYTDKNNVINARIKALFYSSVKKPDDPYSLNGQEFGLMYKFGENKGFGLLLGDNPEQNATELITVTIRTEDEAKVVYVPTGSDLSVWKFHSKGSKYVLSVDIDGVTRYLKISGTDVTLADTEEEATEFDITKDDKGRLSLSLDEQSIYYDTNTGKFVVGSTSGNTKWLNLTKVSDVSDSDLISYSAIKVGVSDERVKNQSQVILYTRVWNNTAKTYEFYAVDYDGSLYPCYERGDNIMWTGKKINTLLWTFTEYYYENGTPNNYYELQNNYSKKYIAPNIAGQILSDGTIGINMRGRKDGEYYSTILAWDDPHYSYAGIRADVASGSIVSCPKAKAEDFYFAIMDTTVPTLTEVETIDNSAYGISMKMYDFTDRLYMAGYMGNNEEKYLTGLLSTDIKDNGYPNTTKKAGSLADLFNPNASGTKYYREVNHLFIKSTYEATGYFEFDSCQNFATLYNPETGALANDFTVYKELGTTDEGNKSTLKHGQFFPFNTIVAGEYASANPENLYCALADYKNPEKGKLDESDPRKYEKLHLIYNPEDNNRKSNCYNGMEIEASFAQTPSGHDAWGHDIVFEFTGDDDFWLYVDDELVIDLGGIHSALGGKVNFSTGVVVVDEKETNLRAIFEKNYKGRNPGATDAEVKAYLDRYFAEGENIFKDYTTHHMKIFYMERGGGASNLHMRFNLSSVTPGSVFFEKKVTGTEDLDFELVEYPYQIWYIDDEISHEAKLLHNYDQNISVFYQNSTQKVDYAPTYKPPGTTITYDCVYFLQPEKVAEIKFPRDAIEYRIIECGINTDVYDEVKVNGVKIDGTDISVEGDPAGRASFDSGWMLVSERSNVEFENHVRSDGLRTLRFQKKVKDETGQRLEDDPTTFSFRLYLSNGINDELVAANMVKYCVKDPNGYLCRRDHDEQKFVPTGYMDYSELTQEEKEEVTFNTSPNGSISKIPAWYSVEVPNIPVGTKFKFEERFSETPIGFGRTTYERDESTYIYDRDVDKENEGRVRANESPVMNIINERGYGIQANKVWSDKAYTKWHETIYTALYIVKEGEPDRLVENNKSIRELKYPATNVRYYFFDGLEDGMSLSNYQIREVKVIGDNIQVDEDGVVTGYDSIEPVGDSTQLLATAIDSDTPQLHDYSVSYDMGEEQKSIPELPQPNIRTDTITNTRDGGLCITLYDMSDPEKPLANGKFSLEKYNSETNKYEPAGSFVSDSNGRVTILYDFERDTEYRLTETVSPKGYRGLPNPVTFSVSPSDEITIDGNVAKWQRCYPADHDAGDKLTGYIDLYNMPYTIEVYKYDGEKQDEQGALKEAYFDLYKGLEGFGGIVKDFTPLYSDLKTEENGYIPGITTGLEYGTYYLTEKAPPSGYVGLDGDVIFEITSLGNFKLKNIQTSGEYRVSFEEREENGGKTVKYFLNIPNTKDDQGVELTVRKIVAGNMGSKAKGFNFTFETEAEDDNEYPYKKKDSDGNITAGTIRHGDNFTLAHGEEIVVTVKKGTDVTVSEDSMTSDGYTTTVSVDFGSPETVNSKKIQNIEEETILTFTNTRNGAIPTGVSIPIGMLVLAGLIAFGGIFATIMRQKKMKEQL